MSLRAMLVTTIIAAGCGSATTPVEEAPTGTLSEPTTSSDEGPASGDAPVAPSRRMVDLTEEESAQVCAWLDRIGGEPRVVQCVDGTSDSVGREDCSPPTAFAGCTVTIGELGECLRSIVPDPCAAGLFATLESSSMAECVRLQFQRAREAAEPPPAGDE